MTWLRMDENSATVRIVAAEDGRLYQLHDSGAIWMYAGGEMRWLQLDANPATVDIVATRDKLYQRHRDGKIWEYTGPPMTGWRMLDRNPSTIQIAASPRQLYQRHRDGRIWFYTGTPHTGWAMIDNSGASQVLANTDKAIKRGRDGAVFTRPHGIDGSWLRISGWTDGALRTLEAASDGAIYALLRNGQIHRYSGSGTSWTLLDRNPATVQISAGGGSSLYKRHRDGSIWKFTGTPISGWLNIDRNAASVDIDAGADGVLYQRHSGGGIFRDGYAGRLEFRLVLASVRCIDETEHEGPVDFISGEGLANDAMRLKVIRTSRPEGSPTRQDVSELMDLGSNYEDGTIVPVNRNIARFLISDRDPLPFTMSTVFFLIEEDWFGDLSKIEEAIRGYAEATKIIHSKLSELVDSFGTGYWKVGALVGRIASVVEPSIANAVLAGANDVFPANDVALIVADRNAPITDSGAAGTLGFLGHGGQYELTYRWVRSEKEISPPVELV